MGRDVEENGENGLEVRWYRVDTSLGVFGAGFTKRGLCQLNLPGKAPRNAQRLRGQEGQTGRNLKDALELYATGRKVAFRVPLDLSNGTPFQRKVWKALKDIPFGQVLTYADVARKVGQPGSARAVGTACSHNPVPVVVPCHRVIGSNGSLAGFSGGVPMKKKLLSLEGYRP